MSSRIANWDMALMEYVLEVNGQEFEWGQTDCASLVRKCLITILGVDAWEGHVRDWSTKVSALRVFGALDINKVLFKTGADQILKPFSYAGDLIISPNTDIHRLIQIAMVLPVNKVLTSSEAKGVEIISVQSFIEGTTYWRYV